MAERAGVELRYPFLDRQLVEFTMRMPARQRIRGRFNKYVHRKAMAGLLPDELCKRQGKANFMGTFGGAIPEILIWLEQNREVAGIDAFVCWEELKSTSKDVKSKDFGGWPEFMLWTIFGCGLLSRQQQCNRKSE